MLSDLAVAALHVVEPSASATALSGLITTVYASRSPRGRNDPPSGRNSSRVPDLNVIVDSLDFGAPSKS